MIKSQSEYEAAVKSRLASYKKMEAKAGVSFPCLNDLGKTVKVIDVIDAAEGTTLRIQGPLDWLFGADVRALIKELDRIDPQVLNLLIESPGGFLSDGLAIYNDLRARAGKGVKITATATGLVASAATLPFLAADTRNMQSASQLAVHNPYVGFYVQGNAESIENESKKLVQALKNSQEIVNKVYINRTGQDTGTIQSQLNDETFFTADQAVKAGYATAVTDDTAGSAETMDPETEAQVNVLAKSLLQNVCMENLIQ